MMKYTTLIALACILLLSSNALCKETKSKTKKNEKKKTEKPKKEKIEVQVDENEKELP